MALNFTPRRRSLRIRVTLLSLIFFLIGIWSLTYYASLMLRQDLHRLLGEQQFSTASIVADDLNHEIDFRLRALEKAAAEMTPAIFSNTAALQTYLEDLQLLPRLFSGGYFVTQIDGTATASLPLTAKRRGVNFMERDHIAAALREGKSTVSKPVIGKMLRTPVVSMAAPIHDSTGKIIGALAGVVDLSKPNFLDEIAENRYGKTGGFLLVAPQHRLVVTASDKSRVMEKLPPPGVNPGIDRFIQGFEGFQIFINPKGVEVLASARGVPAAGWYVAAVLPTEEAFSPIRYLQRRMVLATLILTILVGGLTWWMLRRQLSPMFDAVRTLSLLSDANLPVTALPITRQDEVGLLIGAFNRLLEVIARREVKLRESEEYQRSILKTAMDGFWLMDTGGHLLEVNAAYCRMSGYSEQELLTMRISDLDVEETADDTACHIRKIMTQGQDRFESRHRRKDGSFFDVEIRAQYHPAYSGRMVVFLRDITDSLALSLARRQAEESLRKQEQFARATIDGLSTKICVIDDQGKIVITNRGWDRFAEANNAVVGSGGKGVDYLNVCRITADACATDTEEMVSGIKAVMDGILPAFIMEYPCHSSDVERWFSCKVNPFTVSDAKFVVISQENITARKRSELALRAERQRLAGIIKGTNVGTWEWNVQTGETIFNERWAEIIGYTLDEISPLSIETWKKFSDPDDLKASNLLLEKHFRGELDYYEFESRMVHKDGSLIWVLDRGRVMTWSEDGKPLMMMGTHQDITERKRAETERAKLEVQLQQSQKMESVGRLAGGVAHDFNNMLGVILGHAELALLKIDHSNRCHDNLVEIRKAAERSANLTRQLLAYARKQTITPRAMNLNETISGMLKMLQRLIGENIDLTWQPAADLWQVKADPSQIDQILANLCVNSRDAMEKTGRITIETQNCILDASYCANYQDAIPGEYVRLSVSDDGNGMAKEILANIFEPFYTTKEVGKGTGLGLATVFGIVKQNNGHINVFSEPGQGTTFSIYLPRLAEERSQPLSEEDAVPLTGGRETILLVEDEPAILDLTATILEEQGYSVLKANTPREALQLASACSGEIHLLMTDVIMPEMNGWDLAKKLLSTYPRMKHLFMSGYTADVISHHGVLDADVHFIQKPFSLTDMVAMVRAVLDT